MKSAMPFATLLSAIAILLALAIPGHNIHNPRVPAYAQRGDEVEALFGDYSTRLAGYHEDLQAALAAHAADLLSDLARSNPEMPGYQVLPAITAGDTSKKQSWSGAVAYSWPWTARLIDRQLRAISRSEHELERIKLLPHGAQRTAFEKLLQNYRESSFQHRNIAAHIAYNRFWQGAIAADRFAYDRETALQRLVLQRQKIDQRLQRVRASFITTGGVSQRAGASIRLAEIERDLLSRSELLGRRIDEAMEEIEQRPFVQMERSSESWVFRVPVYTDIVDLEFVATIKRIIESTWRLDGGSISYAISLDMTHLSPQVLYDGAEPNPGERLELRPHLRKFPAGGAILTTGGITTHVRNHAIVLGPQPLTARTIAHEFGHILGFRDRYVRGYKNLGRDGFQVVEIVADPADIMAATTQGSVQPKHFSLLAEHYGKPVPALQPINRQESKPVPCGNAAPEDPGHLAAEALSAPPQKCQSL